MSREELRTYLAEIIKLETKRYEISLIVSKLEKERITYCQMAEKPVYGEKSEKKWTEDIWKDIFKSAFITGLVGIMAGFSGRAMADYLSWMIPFGMGSFVKINALWGFTGFFLISMFILIIHVIWEKHMYNVRARRHNQKRESRNRKILEESRYAKRQLRILEVELLQLNEGYWETDNRLQEMYNDGVIYPKYRELAPISRFYEYISSGRCSRLDGTGGAYNLYENELMAKAILDSLENYGDESKNCCGCDI